MSAAFQPTPEQRAAKLAISIRKARLEAKTAASTESYIKRGRILSRGIVHLLEPGSYNQPGYRNEMPRWMLDLWGSIETNYNVARQDARTGYRSGWLGL